MAERRMFAKTIIDSDAFLDMPLSTQALYFHLSMRADDDGFLNNPKKIMRMIGASQNEMELLMNKNFIFSFESGVVIIKHWKIHNYIRNDRYKETKYLEEKSMLSIKKNGAYTLSKNNGIPDVNQVVYQMETQDRLGKDRLGKDRLGTLVESSTDLDNIVYQFNEILGGVLPKVKTLSKNRKAKLKNRTKELKTIDEWVELFVKVYESDFLTGRVGNWKCNFDWLIANDSNYNKVLEGNYRNKGITQVDALKEWMGD